MIRRDYILRMIEEFVSVLSTIKNRKKERLWKEAQLTVDQEARRLTGMEMATLATLTETEIWARLLQTGEFHAQTEKTFMLATLFLEEADVQEAASSETESNHARDLRLKSLHLLLNIALREDVYDWPEFVPTIDLVVDRLSGAPLPLYTHALLMQYFERTGQFAKAEDEYYALRDLAPENPTLGELGISFYNRLLAQSDHALDAGNLPRSEVEAGLSALSKG